MRLVPVVLLGLVIAAVTVSPSLPAGWPITAPERESNQAAVATDTLNLRAAPTLDAPIVAVLASGERVEVVGDAQHGFSPVRYKGSNGWLAVEYLSFGDQAVQGGPAAVSAATVDDLDDTGLNQPALHAEEPSAPPERWIRIDRSDATVTLYEGETAIAVFAGRIGRDRSADGFYSTAVGTYHVYSMNKGLAPTPFAEDTYLSDWVGFDPLRHNGIHSPVRNVDGSVREWQNATTLGCVRLSAEDAVAVFAFAEIGMRVVVRE